MKENKEEIENLSIEIEKINLLNSINLSLRIDEIISIYNLNQLEINSLKLSQFSLINQFQQQNEEENQINGKNSI